MSVGKDPERRQLTAAEIGAIAHLYRGEVYRSTIWRTRLDTTTNWSVVTLGVALSIAFSSPEASPLPLILVGVLISFFLMLEARRYRYFNVWRARCRWIEVHFYAPMLYNGDLRMEDGWQHTLADDYCAPSYHVPMRVAIGRRIRRNYFWILLIQTTAYIGKIIVHPAPLTDLSQLSERAAIGPLNGHYVLGLGAVYCLIWGSATIWSWRNDLQRARDRQPGTDAGTGMG
ncbi:MAG: DUF2270 domain-containing protein [Rhodothermales bacterium]|nr:DUF2270 domain-containing protein [Rhodothermales bacterium]